ncbi:MAG: hypothetical protein ACI8ZB_005238, partial [Desulforhopalus sp.]
FFISDACQGIFYLNHNFNFKMFTKSSFINYTIAGFPGRPGIADILSVPLLDLIPVNR